MSFQYTSGDINNLLAGDDASMADIQGPFVDLRDFLNGGLTAANLSASAAITETQLAPGATGLTKGAFSAYRNAAQAPLTGAVVVFDTEEFDVSSWFDVTTGRFTPQVAARYRLSWSVYEGGGTLPVDAYWYTMLRKNGADFKVGMTAFQRGATANTGSQGTAIVQANGSTDFYDVIINHSVAGTQPLLVGAARTYFQGEMIGRV